MHVVSHLASKDAQSNASPQVALIAEGVASVAFSPQGCLMLGLMADSIPLIYLLVHLQVHRISAVF